MAHFAELDQNNVVTQVVVISNDDILDGDGNESEEVGIQFCKNLYGDDKNWIQTSYNNKFRYKYAAIGDTYDPERDAFVSPGYIYLEEYDTFALPPKFPSWVWSPERNRFVAPVQKPVDTFRYLWNEETLTWDLVEGSEGWRPWNAES